MAGIGLPAAELGLAVSVIVLGAMAALGARAPRAFAMALVAAFATLHGHAHGVEMPPDAAAATYALGFLTATALLHASGIAAGSLIGHAASAPGRAACRIGGAAVSVAGVALLAQVI